MRKEFADALRKFMDEEYNLIANPDDIKRDGIGFLEFCVKRARVVSAEEVEEQERRMLSSITMLFERIFHLLWVENNDPSKVTDSIRSEVRDFLPIQGRTMELPNIDASIFRRIKKARVRLPPGMIEKLRARSFQALGDI